MPDATRHSRAEKIEVTDDPDQLARLEIYNTVQQ